MPENLFAELPHGMPDELMDALVCTSAVRIERIVSHGHSSPPGFWCDQAQAEWVVVLRGAARLRIEGRPDEIQLGPGDHLELLPHQRHRVEWTTPDEPTVWLAVHYSVDGPASQTGRSNLIA